MKRFISTTENIEITNALIARLRSAAVDEVIHKAELDNLIKGKIHLLTKARRIVEREDGCIFATIIREGLKKLPYVDVHLVGEKSRVRAARSMNTAQGRIIGVVRSDNLNGLNADERLKITNEVNKLGLLIEYCK